MSRKSTRGASNRRVVIALGVVLAAATTIVAVATVVKLRLDRVQQAACTPGPMPAEPAIASDEFRANLAVTSLAGPALSERAITRKGLGELDVETGCIVATDPLVNPERPAFARVVAPGVYPVTLYEAQGRVALAELRLAEGEPRSWVLALLPGQDARALKGDEVYGYPVDAGLGSFMDVTGQAAYLTRDRREQRKLGLMASDSFSDVLQAPLEKAGGKALLYEPLDDDTGNLAVFQSGWGDGVYPSYWGLDEAGRPIRLVTDFGVLTKGDGREPPDPTQPIETP